MRTLIDQGHVLSTGLEAIRTQYSVPASFPPDVLAAAEAAAHRQQGSEHTDRTAWPFVTLDPASSTDLDQAFTIERGSGDDLLLHYAIADVAWFVQPGDALDAEAWTRGNTLYLPDGKAGLYPPALAEGAASLLPDGPRPAVVFHVRIATDGHSTLDGVERCIVRSRAKLGYETVRSSDLPAGFDELYRRAGAAEQARGAARVDPAEQDVVATVDGFELAFRPRRVTEDQNAALSLSANIAVAEALYAAHTGLFRVMAPPDDRHVKRLRHTAAAFGVEWPAGTSLHDFQRSLDPGQARQAAMMLAIRRTGTGASYAPYAEGVRPWHDAIAATYAHATAPLRRLADRYVIEAARAVAAGQAVPDAVTAAFARLPKVMDAAEALGSQLERAVVDLAEAVTLRGLVGTSFAATVTDVDERGARIQLCDEPVVARVTAHGVQPGDRVTVRLDAADPATRSLTFTRLA